MTPIQIKLRNGRTTAGRRVHPDADEIELDKLSPRARALAEALATPDQGMLSGRVWVETDRPLRDLIPLDQHAHYTEQQLDQPRGFEWSALDEYPADSPNDPHWWLERQAAKIPAGHHIAGKSRAMRVATTDTGMTVDQVVATLARHHIYIKPATWRGYVSRGQAPEPEQRIGRTPLWAPEQILSWIAQRPGPGARTDLTKEVRS